MSEAYINEHRQARLCAQDFMTANPTCNRVSVGGLYLDRSGNVSYTPFPEPGSISMPANADQAEDAA